jgi:hypothetical protein
MDLSRVIVRRRQAMAVVIVFTIALVGGIFLTRLVSTLRSSERTPVGNGAEVAPPDGIPIPRGRPVSLGDAASLVPFKLLRPQHPWASDKTLSNVWVSPNGSVVALEYESGLLMLVQRPQFADPEAEYEGILRDFPYGSITHVGQATVLVMKGNISGRAPSIDMVVRDTEIQVQGRTTDVTVDDLLGIAASIESAA